MSASPPILCFVGRSGTGKTTLIVEVIRLLRDRGWRVVSVKHDAHGAQFDTEGKDSWRHKEAGAETVVLIAPGRVVSIGDVNGELTLEEVRDRFAQGVDLMLAEGFKRAPHPKIEVARAAVSRSLLLGADDHLVAVATDFDPDVPVPKLDLNDSEAVTKFVEEKILGAAGSRR
jgi:molybdopterin-guanine dinucleotide biosynthesis protein B